MRNITQTPKRQRRHPKRSNKHTRRTYIISSYTRLVNSGKLTEDGYAMRRWNYLQLNDYNLNT